MKNSMRKFRVIQNHKKLLLKSILIVICFFGTMTISCKKLVEVPPPVTELTSDNVYTNNATAAAVLTGIYTEMTEYSPLSAASLNSISLVSGLSADEFTLYGGSSNINTTLVQYYENLLTAGSSTTPPANIWSDCYSRIYIANIALENLARSTSLTPAVKQQLMGEAKFIRAFFYFYLVNLYGDVPLTTISSPTVNAVLARSPKAQVYQQIIADLVSAQTLLSDGYVAGDAESSTTERVRPNKWAATALLARTYLYYGNLTGDAGNYTNAINQSTAVINNSSEYNLTALNSVFLKNSNEAIWQFQPVNTGWNTPDAQIFILPATGPTSNSAAGYPVYLSPQLLGAFEQGDQRKVNWVESVTVNGTTYSYPYKYKSATIYAPVTEYTMVLRLGEQYLIRAEAEANNNQTGAAVADLNMIRNRAGLPNYTGATDKASLLAAILHERQVEFFTEWGSRWLDLKRTGNANTVMVAVAPLKGTTWNAGWQLYPLPSYDIVQDPKLVQNPGY
jgi:hypothetical protein